MDNYMRIKRKPNPRDTSNWLSLLTFTYTYEIFARAVRRDLEERDLYAVLKYCESTSCGDAMEKRWKIECENRNTPSIFRMLFSLYGFLYIFMGIGHLSVTLTSSIVEPYAISHLVGYFKAGQTETTKQDAMFYAAIVAANYTLIAVYFHNIIMVENRLGLQIRSALSSLMYRKLLKLQPSLNGLSLGNMVTLITKDVYSIEDCMWVFSDSWNAAIRTVAIAYLLYNKMGNVGFVGVGFLLTILPLQLWLGKRITNLRLTTGKRTDARLQLTQEALSAIKIIKMYTWEKYFTDRITETRRKEVYILMITFYQQLVIVIIGIFSSRVGFYILIMTYIWLGHTTNTELIFYVLTLFNDLNTSLTIIIPFGLAKGAEMYASIIRIHNFLSIPEIKPADKDSLQKTSKPKIEMKNVSFSILRDINCTISTGLTIVTGYVGSGKSTFLKTILKEHEYTGDLNVEGTISYASQEPWLFPSTIKQNIIFGTPYNDVRYNEVLRLCALKYDLELLSDGDETLITDKGMNLSKGQQARINLARAIYRNSDIYLLDDCLTALDTNVQEFIFNECFRKFLRNKICVLVTQNSMELNSADNILVVNNGSVILGSKLDTIALKEITSNVLLENEKNYKNKTYMNNGELERDLDTAEIGDHELIELNKKPKTKVYSETKKKGTVNLEVYKKYILFGGGFPVFGIIVSIYMGAQIATNYSDKLLTQWVDFQQTVLDLESNQTTNGTKYEENVSSKNVTMNLYSIMILVSTILTLLKYFCLLNFCRKAALNIHKRMISCAMNATMAFFDNHFIGNILNRFSQDLFTVDEHLPPCFTECIRSVFGIIGTSILLTTVNYIFLLPTIIFFLLILLMRYVYLIAARSLQRLESSTRSPMIGYVNATLEGLTTIRAFGAEQILKNEFDLHQDLFTSARYSLLTTTSAFGFISDLLVAAFLITVISSLLYLDREISAGNAGLAFTQLVSLATTIQWAMRQWSNLENRMTSVERALEYTEIKQEIMLGDSVRSWPQNGLVVFKNVSLNYNGNSRVLNNINFVVKPMEKIGIVGRTGAGKSSIIAALFRIYDFSGEITIDNVDIKAISLKSLRQNIAIIPQDPILFSGTIRSNIDPDKSFLDSEIWSVFKKVQLDGIVDNLDVEIGTCNYSAGQKQMICLARAIIRKCKIIVLDEATSNMDPENENLLQHVMKEQFRSCTVFIIAHRLNSVLECNNVLVLSGGELLESGKPVDLLRDKNSHFYKMIEKFGIVSL